MAPFFLLVLLHLSPTPADAKPQSPESRALAFLAREVPAWSAENRCYSCHNNGDAARALYQATVLGHSVPPKTLEDTTRWLTQPAKWDKNGGEGAPKDEGLARVQFAAALLEARAAGLTNDPKALEQAAASVAEHQKKDGSWKPDGDEAIGSPATYGAPLMTYQARRVLQSADARRYREAIASADRWLREFPVKTVLDAAAVLLALEGSTDANAKAQRSRCLDIIKKSEAKDGGWGPYVDSAPEVFDTALVLLALQSMNDDKSTAEMSKRGRTYLIVTQRKDGSWQETTRPSGGESYAQRISTSGWATLALLKTAERK